MQAIIKSGGHQYRVAQGAKIAVNRITTDVGSEVEFGNVLAVADSADYRFGAPYLADVVVKGKVVTHARHSKVTVFKYKRRKNYKRTKGWRQPYTEIEITSIAKKGLNLPSPLYILFNFLSCGAGYAQDTNNKLASNLATMWDALVSKHVDVRGGVSYLGFAADRDKLHAYLDKHRQIDLASLP